MSPEPRASRRINASVRPGWPKGATGRRSAEMSTLLATDVDLPIGRDRAPGSRPGPYLQRAGAVLAGVPLAIGRGLAAWRASRSFRRRLGGRSPRLLWAGRVGGRSARVALRGGLPGLRIPGQAGGVRVPVRLAHPAKTVLLARLAREVVDRGVVGLDPEPGRADAPSKVCHNRRRPLGCGRSSGGRTSIHHSDRPAKQVRGAR